MTHTYNIQGMTCGGCLSNVREALLGVTGIARAEVTLSPPQAVVTMTRHVSTAVLSQVVAKAGHFALSESTHGARAINVEADTHEGVSFKPIYLLFAYIGGTATLIGLTRGDLNPMNWMSAFMAVFFLTFSFFKVLDVRGFAAGYATYDIVARRFAGYGLVYPFIELALGIAYVVAPWSLITNASALVVMGVSSIGVLQSVLRNSPFQCACLGTIFKLPLSKVTLVEDLLMVVMSASMLFLHFA